MPQKYEYLRDDALDSLRSYMDGLTEKKGATLAYWVKDYVKFLKKESDFNPTKLIRYKRGSVVKVHLGYRVGSEEGGLHYAIVIDTAPALSSQTLTVIPLTSVKNTTSIEKLHYSKLYLGDEIYQKLSQKSAKEIQEAKASLTNLSTKLATLLSRSDLHEAGSDISIDTEIEQLKAEASAIDAKVNVCEKTKKQIQKMKRGSIALVGQITTVSKIRIYDPLYPTDTLSGVRVSDQTMDKIDAKIKDLYTK